MRNGHIWYVVELRLWVECIRNPVAVYEENSGKFMGMGEIPYNEKEETV